MPYIGNEVGNRFVASKAASVYSGNGSTTAFTLEHAVGSDEDILVSVDGVIQEPSVAYAVSSGTTLTFTAAPSSNSGNNIFVYYLFRTVATVDHPATSALSATSGTFSTDLTVSGAFTSQGIDDNADATAITIDSSENVMINTTNTNPAEGNVVGVSLMATNAISASDDGNAPIQLNRKSSDGDIAIFRKDGSGVGSIGSNSSDLYIGEGTSALRFDGESAFIYPYSISGNSVVDNSITLGSSSYRFKDLYLSSGVFLGGTGSANELTDYEEGTFTATAGNSVTLHSNYDLMRYTKIGKMVTVTGQVRVNSDNSNAGFRITNFPFAHAGNTEGNGHTFGAVRLYLWDVPSEFLYAGCFMAPSTTTAYVEYVRDNGSTVELPSTSDAYIMFGYTYPST